MNKEIIKEEIERLKLLMKYDTKKTLSENTVKIISEQWKGALEDMGKVLAHDAEGITRSLENAFKDGTIKMDLMVLQDGTKLTKMADVLESIRMGTLGPSGIGSVAKGLFLRGSSTELRALGADTITSMGKFTEKFTTKGRNEIVDILMKDAKYSRQDAEVLADTYLKKRSLNPSLGNTLSNTTPKPIDHNIPIPPQTVPKWWKFEWAKDKKWLKRALYVAGAGASLGGIYLAWKTFFGEDDDLPPCIKPLVTNVDEFEKYLINGYVTMGKYTIYQDKKVKMILSTGEELIGKWSYNTETQTIEANFNGKIVKVPCVPGAENPEKNTESEKVKDQNSGVRYRDCTGGPYTQGCKTDPTGAIGQVQQCLDLVVDGKFWVKTQAALVAKGFKDGFKDSDIAIICGGSQQSLEINKSPLDGEQSLEAEDGGVASLTPKEPPAES